MVRSMLRSPSFWLRLAGGWLLIAGVAQLAIHLWSYALGHELVGLRELAMEAMRQARTTEPLAPSLWQIFRANGVTVGLLTGFLGVVPLLLAGPGAAPELRSSYAVAATVLWTVAFLLIALSDPVLLPMLTAGLAVPLHGLVYVTSEAER